MWVLTKVENLHCKICCKTTLIAVDNVSQVCNDQRIALILSLERGAASSYLSSSERSLPRLLHLSYSCTIEAVQQPQYSRTAVQPYALQPFSLPAVVRSYARTPQLDHCQHFQCRYLKIDLPLAKDLASFNCAPSSRTHPPLANKV